MGMLKEFKDFAVKGNVVDMAVGLIIGAAFGKIVTSAVADIIMVHPTKAYFVSCRAIIFNLKNSISL